LREKRVFLFLLITIVLFAVALQGCATSGNMGQDTPKTAYLKARIEFNTLLRQYLRYYDSATKEVQEQWKRRIDPLFREADAALELWGSLVRADADPGDAADRYLEVKNKLIDALFPIFNKRR